MGKNNWKIHIKSSSTSYSVCFSLYAQHEVNLTLVFDSSYFQSALTSMNVVSGKDRKSGKEIVKIKTLCLFLRTLRHRL
jgi:hypothetical protein